MDKINYDKQLADQEKLIALYERLAKALSGKVTFDIQSEHPLPLPADAVDRCNTEIQLWHCERRLETEREVHRQLLHRAQAQQEHIRELYQESLNQFMSLWSRYDRAVERIGIHRIKDTDEVVRAEQLREQYNNKFAGDNDRKALAYGELKFIVKRLSEM